MKQELIGGDHKRTAGEMHEESNIQTPKKRAKSMKLPNVESIKERVYKKFFPPDKVKMKWGNNKYKYYPTELIQYCCELIDKEVFGKELFQRGEEKISWEVINVMLYRFTVGNIEKRQEWAAQHRGHGMFMMIGGTQIEFGRCGWELRCDLLPKLVQAMKMTSSKEWLGEISGKFLWDFHGRLMDYSLENDTWRTEDGKSGSFKEILNEFVPRSKTDIP